MGLQRINRNINRYNHKTFHDGNFANIVLQETNDKKMSITGEFVEPNFENKGKEHTISNCIIPNFYKYVFLNIDGSDVTKGQEFYYGLCPRFTLETIKDAIDNKSFESTENFELYIEDCINNNPNCFQLMFTDVQLVEYNTASMRMELMRALFARTVFSVYKNYNKINDSSKSNFYNGVLPRLLYIESLPIDYGNRKVKTYKLYLQRTTFVTLASFDDYSLPKERLLHNYSKILKKHDQYEDNLIGSIAESVAQEISEETYYKYQIDRINDYFSKSFNYHNINISCNIETKDGYIIYGQRGPSNTDANTIYCSSNGVGEIYDEAVSFYHNSVSEDYPTINYKSSKRVDFLGEIRRETLAELGISDGNDYKLIGLSFINHYDNEQEKKRILNILYKHKSDMDFKEVFDCYQQASEKDENKTIIGIKQISANNYIDVISKQLLRAIKAIGSSKGTINALLAITLFILSIIKGNENDFNIISIVTIGLAIITLLLSCYNLFKSVLKYREFARKVSTIYFYKTDSAIKIFKKLENKFKKLCNKKIKLHPISLVVFSSINKDMIDK